jgi:hypothetical protein
MGKLFKLSVIFSLLKWVLGFRMCGIVGFLAPFRHKFKFKFNVMRKNVLLKWKLFLNYSNFLWIRLVFLIEADSSKALGNYTSVSMKFINFSQLPNQTLWDFSYDFRISAFKELLNFEPQKTLKKFINLVYFLMGKRSILILSFRIDCLVRPNTF